MTDGAGTSRVPEPTPISGQAPPAVPPARIERVAFLGTPDAAVPCLVALAEAGYCIPLVVSQPDRRRGRGSRLLASPVKQAAIELDLAVTDDLDRLTAVDVDLAVVVAYGRLIGPTLLERIPMVNVHFSLLPRWRGAAPVERAILAGDTVTGVSIMRVTEGLDEGPVYRMVKTEIGPDETSADLTRRLAALGADLLIQVLDDGLIDPRPQIGEVVNAAKINRAENELEFRRPASELHRRVRIGRAFSTFRGERLGIETTRLGPTSTADLEPGELRNEDGTIRAGTGDGSLELVTVKPAGKRSMAAIDWWNGARPSKDEPLGL